MAMEPQVKQLLVSLSKAIKGDRSFFVTAKTDLVFDPVRTHVDGLLDQLTREAKIQAEKEIASAQSVLNEMEDWHAHEAAFSEYNSALNTMAKAKENFQTNSYFGYLDAQSLAEEVKKKAKSAIDAQKAHMKGVIDKLKSQAAQLWEIEGGDFDKYEVKRYAPVELEASLKSSREAWKYSDAETYASYSRAQSSYKECLRLGYTAIEKAMEAPRKHEFELLGTALAFMFSSALFALLFYVAIFLFSTPPSINLPLVIGVVLGYLSPVPICVSFKIWDWDKRERGTDFHFERLFGIILGPLAGLASVYYIFQYPQNRRGIEDRYKRHLGQLLEKYTPVC